MLTISKQSKGYKFTGGDNLTGIYKLYHETMMLNELIGGYGAYKVTFAGGESGISFGGNQMDMKGDLELTKNFVKILSKATDDSGNHFFSDAEINVIAGEENKHLIKGSRSLETVFGDFLPRINAALSSEFGRASIDALYIVDVQKRANHIDEVIQKMGNLAAKKFYDSELGRMLLFDYHNQFDLDFDGGFFKDYLHGDGKKFFTTGKNVKAPQVDYTIAHHQEFIRGTKQYYQRPDDCKRRLNNLFAVFIKFGEMVQDCGFTYDWLTVHWKVYSGLKMPEIPSFNGKQFFLFYNAVINYFILPAAKESILFKKYLYYYRADTKQLFYVEGENLSLLPGKDKSANWEIHSMGLSPIEPKRFIEFPGQINPQNYEVYLIKVKKVPVEFRELMNSLGEVMIG